MTRKATSTPTTRKPKKAAATKAPSPTVAPNIQVIEPAKSPKLLTDMKKFYFSVDWAAWWEEFYLTYRGDGQLMYRTARQFANKKGESEEQKNFILFCIGKRDPEYYIHQELTKAHPWVESWDWETRRKTGGWFVDSKMEEITKPIRAQMEALSAMREVGDRFIVKQIARLEKLMEQLDSDFGGRFVVMNTVTVGDIPRDSDGRLKMSLDEYLTERATKRAKLYVELSKQILGMMGMAQEMYTRAHGINTNMDSFPTIVAAAAVLSQAREKPESTNNRANRMVNAVAQLMLEKSATYDIGLPDEVKDAAVGVLNITPGSNRKQ